MNLLEKLKAALKKAGLKEGLADHIKIESEDQIEGIVNQLRPTPEGEDTLDFKKILSSKEFADFVEEKGFDQVVEGSKTLKSGYDRHVSKGIKTFKEKYLRTSEPEPDEDTDDKGGKGGDDMPKWAKALIDKVDSYQKKDEANQWSDQVAQALKKSKLPEKLHTKWASRIVNNGDTKLEDQIKALEEEFDEMGKDFGGFNPGLPIGGGTDSKSASKEEIESLVKDLL